MCVAYSHDSIECVLPWLRQGQRERREREREGEKERDVVRKGAEVERVWK